MSVTKVLDKLQAFRNAEQLYKRNDNLSQKGLQRALDNLKAEREAFRGQALYELKEAWEDVRTRFSLLQTKKALEEYRQAKSWDYSALSYMGNVVRERINNASSPSEVRAWYLEGLQSGDKVLARAMAEASVELKRHFLARHTEVTDLVQLADRRLKELTDSPVLQEVKAEGDRLIKDVRTLQEQHKQVRDFYVPVFAGDWTGQKGADFDKLTEGISLSQNYEGDKGKFLLTLDIQDVKPQKQEQPAPVV